MGTCGIAAVLITGDDGHILIDGATETGAEVIAANIKALGFSVSDVKLLLHSHEHFDHVAGLARLQEQSGAQWLASPEAAPVLRTGVVADADPQAGIHDAFPPARVDGIVREGTAVTLGKLELMPVATPGHSPGALSWQWQSCENDRCHSVVYADSLSPVSGDSYHFSDHPDYVDAYRDSLHKLAALDCQILITPHPSASKMRDRLATSDGLVDSAGCKSYADAIATKLSTRLAKEQAVRHPN